jgi:hypothetical protein
VWVCGRRLAEIVSSNLAGGMDVCLLRVSCVVRERSLCRDHHSYTGGLPSVMCPRQGGRIEAPQERGQSTYLLIYLLHGAESLRC